MRRWIMFNGQKLKKGVSLITVLLFMLVATIAATATFKWLTSEGRTSAARLAQNEARQAAIAGITSVRAWMMDHGNETGALIRQYRGNGKKPIRLNDVLTQMGTNVGNQKFDVWLVSAETDAQPYSLKVVSLGEASNGTKFSEVGILKVSGLFQVKVPTKKVGISFDKAFFGKSKGITGDDSLESGIINGDFGADNNIPAIKEQLLVTGNLSYQGGTGQGGDLYVGGNFVNRGSLFLGNVERSQYSSNYGDCKMAGTDTVVAYIGGDMTDCAGGLFAVCGDLYIGGSVGKNCKIKVAGNLTINGTLYRSNDGHGLGVKKNFVFTDKAAWSQYESYNAASVSSPGSISSLKVGENFVLPPNLYGDKDQNGNYSLDLSGKVMSYTTANTVLLEQKDHNPKYYGVFTDGTTSATANSDNRKFSRYLSFNAGGGIVNRGVSKWDETDSYLKNIGGNYWNKLRKMHGYGNLIDESGKVPTPILLQDEITWKNNTANSACGLGETFNLDNGNIAKLNSCYANKKSELTNGFLVIRWSNTEKKDPTIALDGKFVFYCPNKLSMAVLPKTTENSVVMLFLEQGSGTLLGGGTPFKYFIYSRRNIDEIQQIKLSGGVIMDGDYSILNKYQNKNNLTYDAHVVQELLTAKFIVGNEEYEKRAGAAIGGENSTSVAESEANDSVYVSVSPHLKVTLEAEYKNNEYDEESLNTGGEAVKPSFLVLPRIVYLPKDAKGKLPDYYRIVNLNGAKVARKPDNVSCSPSFPTTGTLKDYSASITQDIYSCTYSDETYGDQSFYVVVTGSLGEDPVLNFEQATMDITSTAPATVKILSSKTGAAKVDVYQSPEPDGWVVTGQVPKTINGDGSKVYTVELTGNTDAFHVSMQPGASVQGGIQFQMVQPCEGCSIGPSSVANVVGEGSFAIVRHSVKEFCERSDMQDNPDCKAGGKWYDEINAPECGSLLPSSVSAWVQARGVGCETHLPNDQWFCSIFVNPNIYLHPIGRVNGCHVANPSEDGGYNIISNNPDGFETLYASLKRDIHTLTIDFENAENSDTKVVIAQSKNDGERVQTLGECNRGEVCQYTVYSGYTYYLTADKTSGKDRFSHWKCPSGNCPVPENNRVTMYVNDDYHMTAVYNENDMHCLFEDFAPDELNNGFSAICDGSSNKCIDYCSTTLEPGKSCRVSEAIHWTGLGNVLNPDWVMVYDNKKANSTCSWDYSGCMCADNDRACRLLCRQRKCSTTKTGSILEPTISNNFIVANSQADDYANVDNATQSVILSSKDNGHNGALTSIFSTAIIDVNTSKDDMLNSGFIFRSTDNASEYFSLSIYGKHAGGKYSPYVYGKLCYVKGQTAIDDDFACVEKFLPTSEWGVDENGGFTNMTKLGLVLKLQNDQVSLNLTVDHKQLLNPSHALSFSLKDIFGESLTLNDAEHNHVGFKLTDKDFKLHDISWSNSDFGEENCFSVPKLVCSFKTNYLGGMVPMGEEVTPWVSFSSFLQDDYKDCSIKYYYNGCDNDVLYSRLYDYGNWLEFWKERRNLIYCPATGYGNEVLGMFWDEGRPMRNGTFKFSQSGKHGYFYTDMEGGLSGFVKDAKVKLECPSMKNDFPSSLLNSSSCGEFYVGEIAPCEKNHDFLEGINGSLTCSGSCSFEVMDKEGWNARDAKIVMKVDNPNNYRFRVVFTDLNGVRSTTYSTAYSGEISFDINDYSNEDGFDPQKIASVTVTVDDRNYIDINLFRSSCPNALNITACDVSYKGEHWTVKATVENAERCGVEIPANSQATAEVGPAEANASCPSTFRFKEPGLFGENSGPYVFTVTAAKGSGDHEITETQECPEYNITPVEIHCSVDKDTVVEGMLTPWLSFYVDNCPEGGCGYSVELNGTVMTGDAASSSPTRPEKLMFNQNMPGEPLTIGDFVYRYNISVAGKLNNDCHFYVVPAEGKAQVSNCAFDVSTKTFTAKVHRTQGKAWSGTIGMASAPLGSVQNNSLSVFDNITALDTTISADLSNAEFKNGENFIKFSTGLESGESCTVTYNYTPPALTCPTNTIDGNLESKSFDFTGYTVTGCNDVKYPCHWGISNGASVSMNGNALHVVDNNATAGTSEYTLSLYRGMQKVDECTILVKYTRTSNLSATCPTNKILVEAGGEINFNPTITGCESGCHYAVTNEDGTEMKNSDGYTGGNIGFKGEFLSGKTVTYTLTVDDNGYARKSCAFQVGYQGLRVNCPTDVPSIKSGENLTIHATAVSCPAERNCTYRIENADGNQIGFGNWPSNGGITFKGESLSGKKVNYKLNVTDKDKNTSYCTFGVNYTAASSAINPGKQVARDYAAGTYTIDMNAGGTVNGCRIDCNHKNDPGTGIVVTIGSTTLKGDWYVGGDIPLSNCSAITTFTVNQTLSCQFNWW